MNKTITQTERKIFQQQAQSKILKGTHGNVRQDKRAKGGERTASYQPARYKEAMSAHAVETKNIRSRNGNEQKRHTVQLTLWVKPIVKEELQRIAKREGLSLSAAGAAIFEKALQQNIDMQYCALLEPIIRKEIDTQMRAFSSRIELLLVRVAFASEQTRNLVTNILGRLPGVKPDILDHILDTSSSAAIVKFLNNRKLVFLQNPAEMQI